jgi:hypothetical protein
MTETDILAKYRTTDTTHGLYEIREEALKFLNRQPKPKKGYWSTLGPDVRIQVPLCAVPLRTRWARESDHEENMPAVLVICDRSIEKAYKKWDVSVGAYVKSEKLKPAD